MKTKQLTAEHLQLLIALQENPMGRLNDLAERLTFSRTTVASYLKWLAGESRTSPNRYFRVVPDFNEDALNMHTVDVFFDTPTWDTLRKVESLCDDHPYTKYRARCYSGRSKIFAQFRIPKGTKGLLTKYFDELKKQSTLSGYHILPTDSAESIFTVPLLEYWDIDTFSWKFDWSRWSSSSIDNQAPMDPLVESRSKLDLLTKNDIHILSILPRGARRKQSEMIRELGSQGVEYTSQDFSRRLKMLNGNFVSGYHVYVDAQAFDLYSNVIITAKCDQVFSEMLRKRIASTPVPFRSTLKLSKNFLFWYLRLPSTHLSEVLDFLHPQVTDLELTMVDYRKTEVYILWPEAFDEEAKSWKADEDFLLCRYGK